MRILWICHVWPEPDSSAAGVRTASLIHLSKARNCSTEVRVVSACQSNDYRVALEEKGICTAVVDPNDDCFDLFLREFQPQIVVFDRFMTEEMYSWRVRAQCPNAMRILDTVDLHFVRRARQRHVEQENSLPQDSISLSSALKLSDLEFVSDDTSRELAAIQRSDFTLVLSATELEMLVTTFRIAPALLLLCSMMYEARTNLKIDFEARVNFVSIGNLMHPPNADSFRLLATKIWPALRERLMARGLNNIELHLYGAYAKEEFFQLSDNSSGIVFKGRATDACQTLAGYRVNLAPLRYGAGVKGKIADGWWAGTPCVASSVAVEGMQSEGQFGGVVAQNYADFIAGCSELYLDKSRWSRAQDQGYAVLDSLFDAKGEGTKFLTLLETTNHQLSEHRAQNWAGQMLWQQQLRCTEFFSRWITEKNRNRPN